MCRLIYGLYLYTCISLILGVKGLRHLAATVSVLHLLVFIIRAHCGFVDLPDVYKQTSTEHYQCKVLGFCI